MHDPRTKTIAAAPQRRTVAVWAFAAMVLSNICLAFGPMLVRWADVSPTGSAFWRLLLAAPLLLVLARFTGSPLPHMPRRLLGGLLLGGLFFAADLAAWHSGILRTKLANAALFGNIATFTFAGYGLILARRMPDRVQGTAILLAAVGSLLLLGRSYELSPQNLVGDMLCVAAGVFYTFYLIVIDKARGVLQPLPVLVIATLSGIIPMLLLALATGQSLWPHNWWPLILLAIGSQVIGQGLLVFALGHLPPLIIGLGLLIQPLMAAIIGATIYGERLGLPDIVGGVAIAVALVLVRRAPAPALAKPAAGG